MKQKLLGMTLAELKDVSASLSLPSYTAGQLARWLYKKHVKSIDQMTNLSKSSREMLSENFETGNIAPSEVAVSKDGTKKYLFPTLDSTRERMIEAVMIPDEERTTLCVSSQAGCKMDCVFCMTGRQGFHGNLSTAEIISQFLNIDEADELTNTVFMGMGEPLDNWDNVKKAIEILTAEWGFGWSPKRITLSTIGVLPNLKDFLESCKCHLAVSLHNPFPQEREQMMPVQKAYDILEIIDLVRQYDFTGQRRVSFEYTMFSGINDDKKHADALIRLLRGLECRVNLIRFHEIPDCTLKTSPSAVIDNFKERLNNAGILTTVRASRGEDILAACGMLSGKYLR